MNTHMSSAVRHPLIMMALGLALALVGLTPALAAPLATNDDIGNATVIGSIPFTDTVDTSAATTAPDEPASCFTAGSTVWYSFTATADTALQANTFGSTFYATLDVYSGTPGALTLIACSDVEVSFTAIAGETYYVMVGSYGGDYDGDLVFTLHQAPPPLEIDVTVNQKSSFDTKTGIAVVSGTVTCNRETHVWIAGDLIQTVGRLRLRGFFEAYTPCTPGEAAQWTATVQSSTGKFAGGKAAVNIYADGCTYDYDSCAFDSVTTTIQLSRKK
jgi:hypothetical protein